MLFYNFISYLGQVRQQLICNLFFAACRVKVKFLNAFFQKCVVYRNVVFYSLLKSYGILFYHFVWIFATQNNNSSCNAFFFKNWQASLQSLLTSLIIVKTKCNIFCKTR